MDSSSDGSFAWTDASNDTIDSETMANGNIIKMHSEDESVSGKTYKKKLQKELFAQNKVTVKSEAAEPLPKEGKRKYSQGQSDSQHDSPKKKKIKREPNSDMEVTATNHKVNGRDHSILSDDSYDESYLHLKVKAEQEVAEPAKRKTKKNRSKSIISNSDNLHDESCHIEKPINKKKSNLCDETDIEENELYELAQEENGNYEKKAKKKKKKAKNRKESSMSDNSNHHDDGDIALTGTMEEGSRSPTHYTNVPQDNVSQIDTVASTPCKGNKTISFQDSHTQSVDQPVNKSVPFNMLDDTHTRTPRISERIQFEEDESSEMETSQLQSNKPSTKSSKLKTFLKNNLNLKPFHGQLKTESIVTVDDEIWIVRCPKDVDIDAFQNKDVKLEGRSKLKLNGQTYEGTVDNESENMSLFSSERNNFVIKSLSVKGFLNLHRRIPKCHMQDELMVGHQPNFIPLPDTKCRHPLFGSNFRKAIKLPAAIVERLREHPTPRAGVAAAESTPPTAARHKRKPRLTAEPQSGLDSCVKPEMATDHQLSCKKKKKKRKHSDSDEGIPKKKKRLKHDLESAEAWESEQAIEENLFDF